MDDVTDRALLIAELHGDLEGLLEGLRVLDWNEQNAERGPDPNTWYNRVN
jgi:hypothetical protein